MKTFRQFCLVFVGTLLGIVLATAVIAPAIKATYGATAQTTLRLECEGTTPLIVEINYTGKWEATQIQFSHGTQSQYRIKDTIPWWSGRSLASFEVTCPTAAQAPFEKVSTIPEKVPPTPVMRMVCLPTEKGQECSVVRSDGFNCNFDYACTTDGLREMKRTETSPDSCIGYYTCAPWGEGSPP